MIEKEKKTCSLLKTVTVSPGSLWNGPARITIQRKLVPELQTLTGRRTENGQ